MSKEIKGKGLFRTLFFLPVIIISGPIIQKFIDMGMMAQLEAPSIWAASYMGRSTFCTADSSSRICTPENHSVITKESKPAPWELRITGRLFWGT